MSHVDFEKNIFQDKLPLGLLILFTMAVFFVGVTEFMLSSMFPPIAKAFNTSIDKVSLLISGYALSYALAAPILGYFSDKINKVKLLLVALLLFSMDGMAIAFSPTIEVAIFLRILGGIASAVIIPTVFSLVADMVPYKNQAGAMGGIMLGMTIGIAFGPALAGSLNDFIHWRSPFIFCAIGCFIIFFIGYFYFQKYNYQGIITVPLKNNSLKKDIN
ncbi:MFS transporter [Xenorhabdus bovienii]